MNKLSIAKTATQIVAGFGTSKIVHTIIKNNVQPETLAEKIAVGVGAFVLGSMMSDAAKKHTDARIDEIVTAWTEARAKSNSKTPEVTV